ncbi:TPA: hypothetical protein EYP38_03065 [Candidatus Micrarchaeota archaeon]|nr:hypothetical protein [Candidatus Micrarchaeota archaeon]
MFFVKGNLVENKEGDFLARAEVNAIYDEVGDEILRLQNNEIKNLLGTTIAHVEKGALFSSSGFEFCKLPEARLEFNGCQQLPDLTVAALWLWLVKGIR